MAKKTIKNPKGAGRKPLDGADWDTTIAKLEHAWACGCPDVEAVLYAGISIDMLNYTIYLKQPELRKRRDQLKERPSMNARINVAESIKKKNIEDSKWYLERKKKKEFSTRQEKIEKDPTIENLDELIEKIRAEKRENA